MELGKLNEEEKKKNETQDIRKKKIEKTQNQFRIVVGKEANDALDKLVGQVNDGLRQAR